MPEGQKNGRGGLGGNTLQRLSRSNEEVAMTELEWIERAVEAYKHLGAHGRALLHDHVGGGRMRNAVVVEYEAIGSKCLRFNGRTKCAGED